MRPPGMLLTAPASGSGKTLITCGILQALVNRGLKTVSFKCGPDYIDPMFHGKVIGTKSRNLDTFFTDAAATRYLYEKNTAGCDAVVVEGVMGYYDGLGGVRTEGSTYDVACTLNLPAILIVNGRGASLSVLAMIKGFLEYRRDSHICGVILNQVSPMISRQLKNLIEQELGIRVFGYVPKMGELSLDSRHLGLVLPGEIQALKEKLNRLAEELEKTLDLDGMLRFSEEYGMHFEDAFPSVQAEMTREDEKIRALSFPDKVRIAVAEDDAFCFTYLDNLELLEELGAELVPFSPVQDAELPGDVWGLILSGGYPELHAEALGRNSSMRHAVRSAVESGMPCIAECGGFLYLHRELEGTDGKKSCRQRHTGQRSFPVSDILHWNQKRISFWDRSALRSADMSSITGTAKAAAGVSMPGSLQAERSGTVYMGRGRCMQVFRICFIILICMFHTGF